MLVFSFHFLVRYLYTLSWSLYNVYKNPQCNWECCVGVILLAQNTRANVTEEKEDQSMERKQVQGDDLEVCFILFVSHDHEQGLIESLNTRGLIILCNEPAARCKRPSNQTVTCKKIKPYCTCTNSVKILLIGSHYRRLSQ